jgi:hypothetical protein
MSIIVEDGPDKVLCYALFLQSLFDKVRRGELSSSDIIFQRGDRVHEDLKFYAGGTRELADACRLGQEEQEVYVARRTGSDSLYIPPPPAPPGYDHDA